MNEERFNFVGAIAVLVVALMVILWGGFRWSRQSDDAAMRREERFNARSLARQEGAHRRLCNESCAYLELRPMEHACRVLSQEGIGAPVDLWCRCEDHEDILYDGDTSPTRITRIRTFRSYEPQRASERASR